MVRLLQLLTAALMLPVAALYPTKAAAEKAAKHFHCTGAHQMGDKWMPCAQHGEGHGSHTTSH